MPKAAKLLVEEGKDSQLARLKQQISEMNAIKQKCTLTIYLQ